MAKLFKSCERLTLGVEFLGLEKKQRPKQNDQVRNLSEE
jgi:hypothetical protein